MSESSSSFAKFSFMKTLVSEKSVFCIHESFCITQVNSNSNLKPLKLCVFALKVTWYLLSCNVKLMAYW